MEDHLGFSPGLGLSSGEGEDGQGLERGSTLEGLVRHPQTHWPPGWSLIPLLPAPTGCWEGQDLVSQPASWLLGTFPTFASLTAALLPALVAPLESVYHHHLLGLGECPWGTFQVPRCQGPGLAQQH